MNHFLWNLSGHKSSIIEECEVDQYYASILGVLMVFIGIYITIAWFAFFNTFIDSSILSTILGIFAGAAVMALDRALLASISIIKKRLNNNSSWLPILGRFFRISMAGLLGLVAAESFMLYIYEYEIDREATLLIDKQIQNRKTTLSDSYSLEFDNLNKSKKEIEGKIKEKEKLTLEAQKAFTDEMSGNDGTGIYGYSTVAKAKEKIFQKHEKELIALRKASAERLKEINTAIQNTQNSISNQVEVFKKEKSKQGILLKSQALESLIEKDETGTLNFKRYIFLTLLLLFELSALIIKALLPTESYQNNIQSILDSEKIIAGIKKTVSIDTYKDLAQNYEKELFEEFFRMATPLNKRKMDKILSDYEKNDSTFEETWENFKEKLMIHNKSNKKK